jgi:hypothetical protein
MRTHTTILALAASLTGACKWTDFDDLADEAWVDSTEKPDVQSSDYGIAIQRSVRSGTGGRLVVLGAGTATYSELAYNPAGESSLPATSFELVQKANIPNIGTQPLLLADPDSDNTSLVVASDNGIAVLFGAQGIIMPYQLFGAAAPTGATYMRNPTQSKAQPLVAVGDTVFGAVLPELPTGTPQPTCKLIDSASPTTALQIRALGVVKVNATTDDVLAWDASGRLYRYPSSVFTGCAPSQAETAVVDTSFAPDLGSQILSVDDNTVVLQGHRGDNGYLRAFSSTAPGAITALGEVAMMPKVRSATILKVASGNYVVAGAPTELVDGKSAGQVRVFKIGATGLNTIAVATLNDAQPENNQSFGRSVVAMPFSGTQVIAVAADNEVFVYFRANQSDGTTVAALYDDARTGP